MKLETVFKEQVLEELRALPRTYVVKIQQVGINGTPDLFACINGLFVAMELKRSPNARVSKLQQYNLNKIKGAGGMALIVHPLNWEETLMDMEKIALRL